MKEEPGGCGCSFLLYSALGLWALTTAISTTQAFIKATDRSIHTLIDGIESWWYYIIHTPYFNLLSVILASLAIGAMIGWALAFRTRLPGGG